jgi:hypothetical protein
MTLRKRLRRYILKAVKALVEHLLSPQELAAWSNERLVKWLANRND